MATPCSYFFFILEGYGGSCIKTWRPWLVCGPWASNPLILDNLHEGWLEESPALVNCRCFAFITTMALACHSIQSIGFSQARALSHLALFPKFMTVSYSLLQPQLWRKDILFSTKNWRRPGSSSVFALQGFSEAPSEEETSSDVDEGTPKRRRRTALGTSRNTSVRKKRSSRIRIETDTDDDDEDEEEEYDWPPLVCCFGEAIKEFIPTVRIGDRQMHPDIYSTWKGLQWSPPEFARAPGGPASNVAIALARLGGRAAFMGKVGDDVHGREMVHTFNINHVQTRGVRFDANSSTGVAHMRLVFENGRVRMSCVRPSAEDSFLESEINVDILKEARMFHFNSSVLTVEPIRSSLLSAIGISKRYGGVIFFDLNLPLPLWKTREGTWSVISEAWQKSNVIEVTRHELEFLLGEEEFERRRRKKLEYFAKSAKEMKKGRRSYHYTPEELAPLWHDDLKILFVTDGTYKIHYYTPAFHGSVQGTEDVLVAAFTCDRTGSGDAIVAGIIRKLTSLPGLYSDQENLEKSLRFAICSGIIAQWTIGAVRGFPTESAAQNLTEQVYPPAMVHVS